MDPIHTHYDNLKVTRNAPTEVIRAAYRALAQKYHPDLNRSPDASRVMKIFNEAWEVLSDPKRRAEHDQWIDEQEKLAQPVKPITKEPSYTAEKEKHFHTFGQAQPNGQKDAQSTSSPRGRSFTVDETKLRPVSNSGLSKSFGAWRDFARALRDPNLPFSRKVRLVVAHALRNCLWYGVATFVVVAWVNKKPELPPAGPKPYVAAPLVEFTGKLDPRPAGSEVYAAAPAPERVVHAYVRSPTAPNGEPWPAFSDYISGFLQLNDDGLSTVTVDNTQNDSDVFVKLVSLYGPKAYPVRQFFISGHGSFTLNQVNAGNYDIRYRDLRTGGLSRSEAFDLVEIPIDNGTRFSNITMTLYKVRNGNMQTYGLAEDEF